MSDERKIASLEDLLSSFFAIIKDERHVPTCSAYLQAVTEVFLGTAAETACHFSLDDDSIACVITQLKERIRNCCKQYPLALNNPLTYLLDELMCNIQQHANTDKGIAYLGYNSGTNNLEILVADMGITIFGSYVAAQKHLDKLGNSDADALNLAQNGYSVKNLPDAENRGYGISSNLKMVVDGLRGEFAIFSGNAILIYSDRGKKILSLPAELDFKGTMVLATIPINIPTEFNMYKYTS